ncbi:MAG: copper amine oxidase N-terminal domain-containing protein, partial [Peptococcaceae bacterium]|nr:copper amine oxidase N-terminal domain-containing protein [Peptococcaceae bacterium]
ATEQALQALADVYYGNVLYDRLRVKSPAVSADSGKAQPQRVIRFKLGEARYEVIAGGQKQVQEADAAPFLENGRTFVPVRYLALALGVPEGGISWSPSAQTVTLAHNGVTVSLAVEGNILYVNDRPVTVDVAPLLLNGRTFLPARYVAEAFGYRVEWDEKEQAVVIKT